MIYSSMTRQRRRPGEAELDVLRSRPEPRTTDGARPETHRPGMEPRNRGGGARPRRAPRRWAVEDRRVGGPGRVVVCRVVRRDRFVRAAATMSRGQCSLFSGIGTVLLAAMARHLPTRGRARAAEHAGPP